MWERETRSLRAFAGDHELTHAPVDVVESQARHFAGTQPETDKQSQDREVAAAKGAPPITARQELGDITRTECPRQAGEAPARHARNAVRQRTWRETVQMTEAEEAPQPGDDVFCRPDAAALALVE